MFESYLDESYNLYVANFTGKELLGTFAFATAYVMFMITRGLGRSAITKFGPAISGYLASRRQPKDPFAARLLELITPTGNPIDTWKLDGASTRMIRNIPGSDGSRLWVTVPGSRLSKIKIDGDGGAYTRLGRRDRKMVAEAAKATYLAVSEAYASQSLGGLNTVAVNTTAKDNREAALGMTCAQQEKAATAPVTPAGKYVHGTPNLPVVLYKLVDGEWKELVALAAAGVSDFIHTVARNYGAGHYCYADYNYRPGSIGFNNITKQFAV